MARAVLEKRFNYGDEKMLPAPPTQSETTENSDRQITAFMYRVVILDCVIRHSLHLQTLLTLGYYPSFTSKYLLRFLSNDKFGELVSWSLNDPIVLNMIQHSSLDEFWNDELERAHEFDFVYLDRLHPHKFDKAIESFKFKERHPFFILAGFYCFAQHRKYNRRAKNLNDALECFRSNKISNVVEYMLKAYSGDFNTSFYNLITKCLLNKNQGHEFYILICQEWQKNNNNALSNIANGLYQMILKSQPTTDSIRPLAEYLTKSKEEANNISKNWLEHGVFFKDFLCIDISCTKQFCFISDAIYNRTCEESLFCKLDNSIELAYQFHGAMGCLLGASIYYSLGDYYGKFAKTPSNHNISLSDSYSHSQTDYLMKKSHCLFKAFRYIAIAKRLFPSCDQINENSGGIKRFSFRKDSLNNIDEYYEFYHGKISKVVSEDTVNALKEEIDLLISNPAIKEHKMLKEIELVQK